MDDTPRQLSWMVSTWPFALRGRMQKKCAVNYPGLQQQCGKIINATAASTVAAEHGDMNTSICSISEGSNREINSNYSSELSNRAHHSNYSSSDGSNKVRHSSAIITNTKNSISSPESPDARETSSECQYRLARSITRESVTSLLVLRSAHK